MDNLHLTIAHNSISKLINPCKVTYYFYRYKKGRVGILTYQTNI